MLRKKLSNGWHEDSIEVCPIENLDDLINMRSCEAVYFLLIRKSKTRKPATSKDTGDSQEPFWFSMFRTNDIEGTQVEELA